MSEYETFRADLISRGFMSVVDLAKSLNITLTGEDGQPHHCGKLMQVKGGILGPDYAECHVCGLIIGNILSPHINGGRVFDEEFYEVEETWGVLSKQEVTQ